MTRTKATFVLDFVVRRRVVVDIAGEDREAAWREAKTVALEPLQQYDCILHNVVFEKYEKYLAEDLLTWPWA